MVEDARFESLAALTTGGLRLQVQVLLAERGAMVGLGQVTVGVEGVLAQRLRDLLGNLLQLLGGLGLVRQRVTIQLIGDSLRQILRDEPLDHVPLVVHDAVDAEVQVRAVELEQLSQELLEFLSVRCHVQSFHFQSPPEVTYLYQKFNFIAISRWGAPTGNSVIRRKVEVPLRGLSQDGGMGGRLGVERSSKERQPNG